MALISFPPWRSLEPASQSCPEVSWAWLGVRVCVCGAVGTVPRGEAMSACARVCDCV